MSFEGENELPEKVNLFEKGIPENSLDEFYILLEGLENADEKSKTTLVSNFCSELASCSDLEIKKALVVLSEKGDVESYRLIEAAYHKNHSLAVQNIALAALRNAQMYLESDLLDESIGLISTGLGGKDNKLRYYLAFRSKDQATYQNIDSVLPKMQSHAISLNSEVESLEEVKGCYLFKILIPMDIAVGVLAEGFIEKNAFLLDSYFCTNVEKPDESQVENWVEDYGK